MDPAAPASRPPEALRGESLWVALRELGNDTEAPSMRAAEAKRVEPGPVIAPDEAALDEDEPAPVALRPQELARWLERNG